MSFDDAPQGHRSTDPETSANADRNVRVTATNQRGKLLATYADGEDATDNEAAFSADLLNSCYWKRCSELREGGYIEAVHDEEGRLVTHMGFAGQPRMVSRITDKGRQALRDMET